MKALRLLALAVVLAAALAAPTAVASPPASMRLVIDIRSTAGGDEAALPSNFAVRAGGTVTVVFRNHTRLFHTFTISRLGISRLIRPARTTKVTFVVPYGVYGWECLFCASRAHPNMHPMRGTMYAIVNA